MSNREMIEEITLRLLDNKDGPNNIKMAYTIGYLQSMLNQACKQHPDLKYFLKDQMDKLD